MILQPTTNTGPLSPSQPSPVGASAYASTGPTRSGCGLSGTHPLSPSPEVTRSSSDVANTVPASDLAPGTGLLQHLAPVSSGCVSIRIPKLNHCPLYSNTGGKMPHTSNRPSIFPAEMTGDGQLGI